jgi:hypothetical protein
MVLLIDGGSAAHHPQGIAHINGATIIGVKILQAQSKTCTA